MKINYEFVVKEGRVTVHIVDFNIPFTSEKETLRIFANYLKDRGKLWMGFNYRFTYACADTPVDCIEGQGEGKEDIEGNTTLDVVIGALEETEALDIYKLTTEGEL